MTVALFSREENREFAETCGNAITALGIPVHHIDYGETKGASADSTFHVVLPPDSTHVLFLYAKDELSRRFHDFYSGFCLGKGLRFLVLDNAHNLDTHDTFLHVSTVLSAETLETFMLAEKERYSVDKKIEQAREQLMDRGISCFPESFFSVVTSGDMEAVRLFLDAGYSPKLRDARGIPALSHAVRSQFPDVVRLLIDAGASVDDVSSDRGYSPLMDAAQKGDEVMCRILLEAGAAVNLASKDGQTALILCAGRGDERISTLLFEHGADPLTKDKLGMSALGYARLFKNRKLLDLFNSPAT